MKSIRWRQNILIGWHLLCREWQRYLHSWFDTGIDAVVVGTIFALSAGHFMPQMGMPREMVTMVFIGTVAVFCISEGYATGLAIALDLDGADFMAYHVALPVSLEMVLASYVGGMMMRMICTTIPIFIYGLWILGDWQALSVSPLYLLVMTLLISFFWSVLFLALAIGTKISVMMGDLWPRLIAPMFCFGASFFPWMRIAHLAPRMARLIYLNPMTHCAEAMRTALLGQHGFIPIWQSMLVLSIYSLALSLLLCMAARRRFNSPREYRPC